MSYWTYICDWNKYFLVHGHKDANRMSCSGTNFYKHSQDFLVEKRITEAVGIVIHLNIVSPEYCSGQSSSQLTLLQLLFPPVETNRPGYDAHVNLAQ
jgi:hypothetical protein